MQVVFAHPLRQSIGLVGQARDIYMQMWQIIIIFVGAHYHGYVRTKDLGGLKYFASCLSGQKNVICNYFDLKKKKQQQHF
jgi:hypothetical protein